MTSLRVLIVEDDAVIAADIATQVEKLGHRVCGTAATGSGAVRLSGERRPDLIVMDVNLEDGVDGIEAAGRIRARLRAPIVFVSGSGDGALLGRIRTFDRAMLLEKPVTAPQLAAAITRAFADIAA